MRGRGAVGRLACPRVARAVAGEAPPLLPAPGVWISQPRVPPGRLLRPPRLGPHCLLRPCCSVPSAGRPPSHSSGHISSKDSSPRHTRFRALPALPLLPPCRLPPRSRWLYLFSGRTCWRRWHCADHHRGPHSRLRPDLSLQSRPADPAAASRHARSEVLPAPQPSPVHQLVPGLAALPSQDTRDMAQRPRRERALSLAGFPAGQQAWLWSPRVSHEEGLPRTLGWPRLPSVPRALHRPASDDPLRAPLLRPLGSFGSEVGSPAPAVSRPLLLSSRSRPSFREGSPLWFLTLQWSGSPLPVPRAQGAPADAGGSSPPARAAWARA